MEVDGYDEYSENENSNAFLNNSTDKFSAKKVELPVLAAAFDKWRRDVIAAGIDITGRVKMWPVLSPTKEEFYQKDEEKISVKSFPACGDFEEKFAEDYSEIGLKIYDYSGYQGYTFELLEDGNSVDSAQAQESEEDIKDDDDSLGEEYDMDVMITRPVPRLEVRGYALRENPPKPQSTYDNEPFVFSAPSSDEKIIPRQVLTTIEEQDSLGDQNSECSSMTNASTVKRCIVECNEEKAEVFGNTTTCKHAFNPCVISGEAASAINQIEVLEENEVMPVGEQSFVSQEDQPKRGRSIKRRLSEVGSSMKKMFLKRKKSL